MSDPARLAETMILNIFRSDDGESDEGAGADRRGFGGSITADRRAEDQRAWEALGIRADHANLPEALLRKKFPFPLFGRTVDDRLVDQICDAILPLMRLYPDANFYFPAGIGNHIDHVACRQAAFRLMERGAVSRVFLYEDSPYSWLKFVRGAHYRDLLKRIEMGAGQRKAMSRDDGLDSGNYIFGKHVAFPKGKALFGLLGMASWIAHIFRKDPVNSGHYSGRHAVFELHADVVEKKKHLLAFYQSQIPMLFGKDPERTFKRHSASMSIEAVMEITRLAPLGTICDLGGGLARERTV